MKGYVYLDLDRNLVYKLADYIDTENPGFFAQNAHLIVKHWKFDTDDARSMWRIFGAFNDLAVPPQNIHLFVRAIKYDLNNLKNANKV